MEIYKLLAEGNGTQQGSRSRYYLRTQVFDVWMRKLIWFPSSLKVSSEFCGQSLELTGFE
jgi:hypothetical protein